MIKKILKVIGIIVIGFFVLGIIGAIFTDTEAATAEGTETPTVISENEKTTGQLEAEEIESSWSYSETEDPMTGAKQYFGATTSTNEVEFEFPYHGGSTFDLVVRNTNGQNELILIVSKGQFLTGLMGDEFVRVKIDDGQPVKYNYQSANDGSTNIIFISSGENLLKKIKSSKKVMIDAPFYQAGRQVAYFDTEGLEWNH